MTRVSQLELYNDKDVITQICMMKQMVETGTYAEVRITEDSGNYVFEFEDQNGDVQTFTVPAKQISGVTSSQAGSTVTMRITYNDGTYTDLSWTAGGDVTTNTAQTITGLKTFSTLPELMPLCHTVVTDTSGANMWFEIAQITGFTLAHGVTMVIGSGFSVATGQFALLRIAMASTPTIRVLGIGSSSGMADPSLYCIAYDNDTLRIFVKKAAQYAHLWCYMLGYDIYGTPNAILPANIIWLQNVVNADPTAETGYQAASFFGVFTPASSDSSNKIATTAWVTSADAVMHTVGNESVAGIKTFTNTITAIRRPDAVITGVFTSDTWFKVCEIPNLQEGYSVYFHVLSGFNNDNLQAARFRVVKTSSDIKVQCLDTEGTSSALASASNYAAVLDGTKVTVYVKKVGAYCMLNIWMDSINNYGGRVSPNTLSATWFDSTAETPTGEVTGTIAAYRNVA